MKRAAQRAVAVGLSLLACLLLLELGSRWWMPISPGARLVAVDGQPLGFRAEDLRMSPNRVFRQISQEYDVTVTTTPQGHRAPAVEGNPDLVFIGDSFTFGVGIDDEQTFAALYCKRAGLICANLGRGGTGTRRQLDILEDFLVQENWRPGEVKLFLMAMTSSLMAGNDLVDNLRESRGVLREVPDEGGSWRKRLIDYRRPALARSNLLRVLYYRFGPDLRTALSPAPSTERLADALRETRLQLERFDRLSRRYGFRYRIYLIHPVQDLLAGTYEATTSRLSDVAPGGSIIDTADVLSDRPKTYYYPYDGHLNMRGAARIAELLNAETQP